MKRPETRRTHPDSRAGGLLMRYLDGELSAAQHREVEHHLAGCPDCAREVGVYRLLFENLAALPARPASPFLGERILAAVRSERGERVAHRRPRWLEVLGAGYAGSAVGLLLVIGLSPWRESLLNALRATSSAALDNGVAAVFGAFDRLVLLFNTAVGAREAAEFVLRPLAPLWRSLGLLAAQPELRLGVSLALVLATVLWWFVRHRSVHGPGRMQDAGAFL